MRKALVSHPESAVTEPTGHFQPGVVFGDGKGYTFKFGQRATEGLPFLYVGQRFLNRLFTARIRSSFIRPFGC